MQKPSLFFTVLKVPLDWLMLVLSGLFVYWLRFIALANRWPVVFEIKFLDYFLILIILAFVWVGLFAISGLYQTKRIHFSKEALKIFLTSSIGIIFLFLVSFFSRELIPSRFIIIAFWFFSIIFVCWGRIFIHYLLNNQFQKGKGLEPIIILGKNEIAQRLITIINKNPNLGYKVIDNLSSVFLLKEKWQGKERRINQIIQADPNISSEELKTIIDFCVENQIIFRYIPDLVGLVSPKMELDFLGGFPIMEIKESVCQGWGSVAKDIFDLIVSDIIVTLLLPVFVIIILAIKLDSPGPAFVTLTRLGARGKPFGLFKFRSMIKDADKMKEQLAALNEREGPLFKIKNDPRITRVGKILRRLSLDELPQFFNVLRGEMSLVGPRPHEPEEVAKYETWHKKLLNVKPGITGLAQISGRSDLSFEEEARLDLYYLQNWSFLFDLEILIKTIPAVLNFKHSA